VIAYVDTSVVLRFILNSDKSLMKAFDFPRTTVSELFFIEFRRTLERLRLTNALNDAQFSEAARRFFELHPSFEVWNLTPAIKQRAAGSFPTVVGTLDALHIATALEIAAESGVSELNLFSFDRQMNICAASLGFKVLL